MSPQQAKIIAHSGLLDASWYRRQYPGVIAARIAPAFHYLLIGERDGKKPNALFDPAWYLQMNPDVATSGVQPLFHYIGSGAAEARRPFPLFDPVWYRQQYQDVNASGTEPLAHYLHHGSAEGRWPNPLFDPKWYRESSTDAERLNVEPLLHYFVSGYADGLRPVPLFDPAWYLEYHRDVKASGLEPLTHYLLSGWQEHRKPALLFDPIWYCAEYPDVDKPGIDPFAHYIHYGAKEGRTPNSLFKSDWYRAQYPDCDLSGYDPLSHYVLVGAKEGRSPIPSFNPPWYRTANADVQALGWDPFAHYLLFGKNERRPPLPDWPKHRDPRRRAALGAQHEVKPVRVAVGIVTYNNVPAQLQRCVTSVEAAMQSARVPVKDAILVIDNGAATQQGRVRRSPTQGNIGFGAAHNRLMHTAFAEGFDYYLAINPDGALEPFALHALLQMAQAAEERALIEAAQFPEEHPKTYSDDEFDTAWASGACLLIPKLIFEKIGGFDESFFMYCEDVDLSWRARAAGFKVKTCPRALFFHPVPSSAPDPLVLERILRSGVVLARKWKNSGFESEMLAELSRRGMKTDDIPSHPVIEGPRGVADFTHSFSFAPIRW